MPRRQVKKKLSPAAWGTILAAAAVVAILLFVRHDSGAAPEITPITPAPALTEAAPAFSLPDIHGRTVSLADYRGKVVILDFWATWCPPCKREIPDFISLQSRYGGKGLQVIGVGLDEPDKLKEFAAKNGMNYAVLLGNDAIAQRYGGISGIPTTVLINRQGAIAGRYEGFRPGSFFEDQVQRLIP